ncbi:hypothetical protein PVNG_02482 [Plasmodium vivax North Korean]|uniref:Aminoacyl-transfer RNA synthetases class-II family profile domain-containing protein n=1 Tax=Plasmodium vivax North Korean TaxID=1035514 RepID=A0A0J9TM03_PLAVI|nr:hypothetical protein PVNG_02482 [Plasmodium vivax North Korean]
MSLEKRIKISELPFYEGKSATLAGFVKEIRKAKHLIFIVLREQSGEVQVFFSKEEVSFLSLTRESVVKVTGLVQRNSDNGNYELKGESLTTLSLSKPIPIEIGEEKSDERHRMRYRYIDLRRKSLQESIRFYSTSRHIASNYLHSKGFLEISTPALSFQSREGAHTFSTMPTKHIRQSFTLSQSPQLYKQLLMIGGFERYFQFANCFRAEELREDRQYEFMQLDLEMSFSHRKELFDLIEGLLRQVLSKLPEHLKGEITFNTLTYWEALEKYGTDKPDTRYPNLIINLTDHLPKELGEVYCFGLIFRGEFSHPEDILSNIEQGLKYSSVDKEGKIEGSQEE